MKHIIRKILREEFNKTNLKKGYELKGSQWLFDFIRYEEGDPKQKGNYKDHPPVILVQTDFDYYADPRASENYYAKMQKEAPGRSQIVRGACGNHDLFPTALLPVLTFFVKHMTTTKFSNLVS